MSCTDLVPPYALATAVSCTALRTRYAHSGTDFRYALRPGRMRGSTSTSRTSACSGYAPLLSYAPPAVLTSGFRRLSYAVSGTGGGCAMLSVWDALREVTWGVLVALDVCVCIVCVTSCVCAASRVSVTWGVWVCICATWGVCDVCERVCDA
eukprot:2133484-Rhodomonas_salina.1